VSQVAKSKSAAGHKADAGEARALTTLEYVVLGLIGLAPQTGYAIVNYFEEGMYSWSASPGSIYPMLRRLETSGVILGEIEVEHALRPRKRYRLSAEGEALLDAWLAEVPRMRPFYEQREIAMLKFRFMEARFTIRQALTWVNNYLDTLRVADAHRASYTEAMLAALHEHGKATVYNQLILEGVTMDQAALRAWLESARERLTALAVQTGEFPSLDVERLAASADEG
jgi:DNA-binding PadR family transcriptional regulator